MTSQMLKKPSREEYIEILLSQSRFNRTTEIVELGESVGRVTAKDIHSFNTLPNEPTSSMDGIAIKFDHIRSEDTDTSNWKLGEEYVYCNTGVSMPKGYDTAIPIELVSFNEENEIQIKMLPKTKGDKVTPRGNVMEKGDLLIPSDYLITPYQLGVLASGGIKYIEVFSKPKVAVIPTGDELIPAGIPLPLGKNIETNSIVLKALIEEWGGEPLIYPIIPDDPEQLLNVLNQAIDEADIVIFNAGSSKGEHDYTIDVLEKAGEIIVEEVAHAPGKPTSLAIAKDKPILGIVGPPLGAELTVRWFVEQIINLYLKQPIVRPQVLEVELLEEATSPIPMDFYAQMIIEEQDGKYAARQVLSKTQKSSRVKLAIESNAVLNIPMNTDYEAGDIVTVEMKTPLKYIKRI